MQQIAPKSSSYQNVCRSCIGAPKEAGVCLGNYAVQFLAAPCSSRVQIPQELGGSILLPFSGTKAVQQHWLLKFRVRKGLRP